MRAAELHEKNSPRYHWPHTLGIYKETALSHRCAGPCAVKARKKSSNIEKLCEAFDDEWLIVQQVAAVSCLHAVYQPIPTLTMRVFVCAYGAARDH